jgi:hypothetical protein
MASLGYSRRFASKHSVVLYLPEGDRGAYRQRLDALVLYHLEPRSTRRTDAASAARGRLSRSRRGSFHLSNL